MQKYCGCVFSADESTIERKLYKILKKNGYKPTSNLVRKLIEENKINENHKGFVIIEEILENLKNMNNN